MGLIDMLHEFHTRPGVDVQQPEEPTLVEGLAERESYLREEFSELQSALDEGDLIGYADALADMVYVIAGSAWRAGIPLDAVLAEVHRSNMTKTASPGDGKAIKGPGYSPPDIAGALAAGIAATPSRVADIDTGNHQLVGSRGGWVTVTMPQHQMRPDDALRHAAWLVAIAEHDASNSFAEVFRAVRNT